MSSEAAIQAILSSFDKYVDVCSHPAKAAAALPKDTHCLHFLPDIERLSALLDKFNFTLVETPGEEVSDTFYELKRKDDLTLCGGKWWLRLRVFADGREEWNLKHVEQIEVGGKYDMLEVQTAPEEPLVRKALNLLWDLNCQSMFDFDLVPITSYTFCRQQFEYTPAPKEVFLHIDEQRIGSRFYRVGTIKTTNKDLRDLVKAFVDEAEVKSDCAWAAASKVVCAIGVERPDLLKRLYDRKCVSAPSVDKDSLATQPLDITEKMHTSWKHPYSWLTVDDPLGSIDEENQDAPSSS